MPNLCFILILFITINLDYLVKGLSIHDPLKIDGSKISLGFIDTADSKGYGCPSLSENECTVFKNETCFGQPFPYSSTSVKVDNYSLTLYNEVLDNHLRILQKDVSCWVFFKPLLCAASRPKCDNGTVYLPSQELCQKAKQTCKISDDFNSLNLTFLNCEIFPQCKKQASKILPWKKYNCSPPLTRTVVRENWVQDIIGCGLECKNPFYSEKEHEKYFAVVIFFALTTLVAALFVSGTSLLIPKFRNYPDLPITYIFIDIVMISLGWLIQIFPGAHKSITCLSDGTLRMMHPSYTDFTCILTFILTYFFGTQAIVWFVTLSYTYFAWSKARPFPLALNREITLFNYLAWIIPYLFTFLVFILNQIAGDPMSGICSVGLYETSARWMLVVVPASSACLVAAGFFLSALYILKKTWVRLITVEDKSASMIASLKLSVGLFCALVAVSRFLGLEAYYYFAKKKWMPILNDYNYLKEESALELLMESKPDFSFAFVQQSVYFFGLLFVMLLLIGESIGKPWKEFLKRFSENFKNMFASLMKQYSLHRSSLKVPLNSVYFQRNWSMSTAHRSNSTVSGLGYLADQDTITVSSDLHQVFNLNKNLKTQTERGIYMNDRVVPSVHFSDSRRPRVKINKEKVLLPRSSFSSTVII